MGKLETVNETKIKDSQYNNLLFDILNYGGMRISNNQIKLDQKTNIPENIEEEGQNLIYTAIEKLIRHGNLIILFK